MLRNLIVGLLLTTCTFSSVASPLSLSGAALYHTVEQYAAFGDHRTATPADRQTSQWLADNLRRAGLAVQSQSFTIEQFFPAQQRLKTASVDIDIFPHWFPQATNTPINATLRSLDSPELNGHIAYLAPKDASPWYRLRPAELAKQAAAKGALALIIAAAHPSSEIYASNAEHQHPLAIPTVAVAAKHHPALAEAMQQQQGVELTSSGHYQTAQAENIFGRFPAEPVDRAPWIVVSTPSSGWFQCAGERGGGVALWLGLAKYIAEQPTQFNWLFVANSGHELGMMGAQLSLTKMPVPESVALWLHLGASIGARDWQTEGGQLKPLERIHSYNRLYAAPEAITAANMAFQAVPGIEILASKALNRSHSELGAIIEHGYNAMGLVGSHHYFHTPGDTPVVTSAALLAPYGEALRRLSDTLHHRPVAGAK